MIGAMLREIRAHIEALADDPGEFYLVCSRYGEQPVPAAGLRFPSRSTAREAARATTQYRQTLRRYDPELPHYDIVVCQDHTTATEPDAAMSTERTEPSELTPATDQRALVTFCHRVAAAVFETLSAGEYDGVETAVMDAYFEHAERAATPDELCLRLLESMARVLAERLSIAEQADLCATAADRLADDSVGGNAPNCVDSNDDASGIGGGDNDGSNGVDSVFDALQARRVVDAYRQSAWLCNRRTGTRSVVVHLSGYAFSPHDGRLPTLPVVVALYGSRLDWQPAAVAVREVADGWRFQIAPVGEATPDGLVSAPINPGEPGR